MSQRGKQLLQTATGQIAELLTLLSTRGQDVLSLACPGREKLGDGSVGATVEHAIRVYGLLAGFIAASREAPSAQSAGEHHRHRQAHGNRHEPERVELQALQQQLSAATIRLGPLAELTDEQLESVPAADSFRYCDGHRTLEQVIARVLGHQDHHISALTAALA